MRKLSDFLYFFRGGQGPGKGPNVYVPIYPITLNDYIYSPGKKIEKIEKKLKNKKPRNNFWGSCQVLNSVSYHLYK